MERDEAKLEVCITRRTEFDWPDKHHWVEVAKAYKVNGRKALMTREQVSGAAYRTYRLVEIMLDSYYITCMVQRAENKVGDLFANYTTGGEHQDEAYEALVQILSEEEGLVEEDKETRFGPKRVELTIRRADQPMLEHRIVVTNLLASAGKFTYPTVTGRKWSAKSNFLEGLENFYYQKLWWVSTLAFYDGEKEDPDAALKNVARTDYWQTRIWALFEKHYHQLTASDLERAKLWKPRKKAQILVVPEDDDDDWDMYGCGYSGQVKKHYTSQIPSQYQPPQLYFRVAGDDAGATLYQEQEERRAGQAAREAHVEQPTPPELPDEIESEPEEPKVEEPVEKKEEAPRPPGRMGEGLPIEVLQIPQACPVVQQSLQRIATAAALRAKIATGPEPSKNSEGPSKVSLVRGFFARRFFTRE